jgi:DNA-nicking Smr family endonuclease
MRHRRERVLSDDEVRLWTHVARTVKAFSGRNLPEEPPPAEQPLPREKAGVASVVQPAANARPALPPLAPLERKTRTALRRGRQPLEAVLDLHGLRQAEAHDRLRVFLRREQDRGARLVLVVTGKGAAGAGPGGDERGVLRRVVPHWLRLADLRTVVLGFEEAEINHGGAGALYVRLRRLRDTTS